MKNRILIVSPTAGLFGGTERVLETLITQIDRNSGISIAFLADGPLVDLAKEFGVPYAVIPRGRFRNPLQTVRTIILLRLFASKTKSDSIFAWTDIAHLYTVPASLGLSPCIWWQQSNVESGMTSFFCRWLPSHGSIANSNFTRKQLIQKRVRVADDVLYPPYESRRFKAIVIDKSLLRKELGLPIDRMIIGSVGRLQKWKGFETIVSAMPTVLRKFPNVCCLLIGAKHDLEPEYEVVLRQQISDLGLHDHVYLFGAQVDVSRWMQAMDIFVHAATNEPFGIVVPEAMSLGLPVIASIPGGPAEAIESEISGLLVQSGDIEQLSGAISRLLESPRLRKSLSIEASRRASLFSSEGFLDRLRLKIVSITRKTESNQTNADVEK